MDALAVSRPEILQVVDHISKEDRIDREDVFKALEEAVQKSAAVQYGADRDIRAEINRKNGEIRLARWTEIIDPSKLPKGTALNEARQIPLSVALKFRPDSKIGGFIVDPLPPIDFGRVAAKSARDIIFLRVKEIKRKREYLEWKDRVGEIVRGTVQRHELGNFLIEIGRTEVIMTRKNSISRENFRPGDQIKVYVSDVIESMNGPQVFVSRTHTGFLAKLFAQEVPEIYDGIIEVKAVAREPGSRAKMAVTTRDRTIDAAGTCIGMRGARVNAVSRELSGERIDIIEWSANDATFIVNALTPANATKIVMDPDARKAEVVIPKDQLSVAIGTRGQNVRLAGELTRWSIDILTDTEERERRQKETSERTSVFVDALNVDDMVARLLVQEGFETVYDILSEGVEVLAGIDGLHAELAEELIRRAEAYANAHPQEGAQEEWTERDTIPDVLEDIAWLSDEAIALLRQKEIANLNDLADLATDELVELLGADVIDDYAAGKAIMQARRIWGD